MDTLDKLFALQQSLSDDMKQVQKDMKKARFQTAKLKLQFKYDTIHKIYQQVSDIILPY